VREAIFEGGKRKGITFLEGSKVSSTHISDRNSVKTKKVVCWEVVIGEKGRGILLYF
jgi:hypothetical protein